MGDKTAIGWTNATWNPNVGCTPVTPGCKLCFAMDEAARQVRCAEGLGRSTHYEGTVRQVKGINVWTGKVKPAPDHIWERPLHWKRPRMIFVNSMSDLYHEDIPTEHIDRAFAIMALAYWHTFQVLTKRSARQRAYMNDPETQDRIKAKMWEISGRKTDHMRGGWPLAHVWLGVSTEDQERANERIPDLLATLAAVRFISAEPLLGPINLEEAWHGECSLDSECWGDCAWCKIGHPPLHNCQGLYPAGGGARRIGEHPSLYEGRERSGLDWVIVGGESDRGSDRARPMHPDWVRDLRDQCAAVGVPFFFKQWGEFAPGECAPGPQTRTEQVATWFNNRWVFEFITPLTSVETHRDDGPDVWRFGTKKSGNTLDGKKYEQFPERRA